VTKDLKLKNASNINILNIMLNVYLEEGNKISLNITLINSVFFISNKWITIARNIKNRLLKEKAESTNRFSSMVEQVETKDSYCSIV